MERAAALALMYENFNSIPEDIQQCLLQIAQYGCDPEQVKRWYLLVRDHFGIVGPELPQNVHVERTLAMPPFDSMATTPNPMATPQLSRQSSTNGWGIAPGHRGSISEAVAPTHSWPVTRTPQTPSRKRSAPLTSPESDGHRHDFARFPQTSDSIMASIEDPQMDSIRWPAFVNSPESARGSGGGQSPNVSDSEGKKGFLVQRSESPSRYGHTMTSTSMPLLIPLENPLVQPPMGAFGVDMSSMPSFPSQVHAPPISIPLVPSKTTRGQKRRRGPRKSVRELMEDYELRRPQRLDMAYSSNNTAFEHSPQARLEQIPPSQPAFGQASTTPQPFEQFAHEPFARERFPHDQFAPAAGAASAGQFHPQQQFQAQALHSAPTPHMTANLPQAPQQISGAQSCPLPQNPFGTTQYQPSHHDIQ